MLALYLQALRISLPQIQLSMDFLIQWLCTFESTHDYNKPAVQRATEPR